MTNILESVLAWGGLAFFVWVLAMALREETPDTWLTKRDLTRYEIQEERKEREWRN